MKLTAKPGSLKSRALDALGFLINLFAPGAAERRVECRLCGAPITLANQENHRRWFHAAS